MNDPTLPIDSNVHLIVGAFEREWSKGERPSIETFLSQVGEADRSELLLQLIALDVAWRRRAGELPAAEEYENRFSEIESDSIERLVNSVGCQDERANSLPSRYVFKTEMARGGMGAVLRVFDRNLNRDLAVKVMLPRAAAHRELAVRFEREARITGGLQHPGIPPVVELGKLADQMPFFSMKLVQGETLAELIAQRAPQDRQLDKLIPIFEQVAQTVAYAHSQGVMHRDLKPANIMVGAFGEVQVMDWGMAKRFGGPVKPIADGSNQNVPESSQATEPEAKTGTKPDMKSDDVPEPDIEHTVDTVRNESPDQTPVESTLVQAPGESAEDTDIELTQAGSVLGTLSYMPPEQARGQVQSLDSRADVFSLGAILLELLVAKTPYSAHDPSDRLDAAIKGDLAEARGNLEQSDADPSLVDLARRCLEPRPEDRPRDAAAVADDLKGYLESLNKRLEQERLQRARAEVRSLEERKRRRLTLTIGALGLMLIVGIAGAAIWFQQDRVRKQLAEQFESEQVRTEVVGLIGQAAILRQQEEWDPAETLLNNAASRIGDSPSDKHAELEARVRFETIDLLAAKLFDGIMFRPYEFKYDELSSEIERNQFRGRNGVEAKALNDYLRDRFEITNHVLELSADEIETVRSSPILSTFMQLVDKWTMETQDESVRRDAFELVIALDDNAERDQVRQACLDEDKEKLIEMAEKVFEGEFGLETIQLLTQAPLWDEGDELRLDLLDHAIIRFPSDFRLRMTASYLLQFKSGDEAFQQPFVEAATGAIAIQPDNASANFYYGGSQFASNRFRQSAEAFGRVIAIDPSDIQAYRNRAFSLMNLGRMNEANQVLAEAIENNPDQPGGYESLGLLQYQTGRLLEARANLERSVQTRDERDMFEDNIDSYILALCLARLGETDQAMQYHRRGREEHPSFEQSTPDLIRNLKTISEHAYVYELLGDQLDYESTNEEDKGSIHYQRALSAVRWAGEGAEEDDRAEWQRNAADSFDQFLDHFDELVVERNGSVQTRTQLKLMLKESLEGDAFATLRNPEGETLSDDLKQRWQQLWTRAGEFEE